MSFYELSRSFTGLFDVGTDRYETRRIDEELDVVSLFGNVALSATRVGPAAQRNAVFSLSLRARRVTSDSEGRGGMR